MADPEKLCTQVRKDPDKIVNRKAFANYLWYKEEASEMRKNVGCVDGAYEKARDMQKTANEYYMVAVGLRPGTVTAKSANKPPGSAGSRPPPWTVTAQKTTVDEQDEEEEESPYEPSTEDEEDESSEDNASAKKRMKSKRQPKKTEPKQKKTEPRQNKTTATTKWAKCAAPPLEPKQLAELSQLVQERWTHLAHESFNKQYPVSKYYLFAERVGRHYVKLWSTNKSDKLHLNRDNLTRAAVATVYEECKPYSDKPHYGNNSVGRGMVLPLLEKVFNMPLEEHKRKGSDEWIAHVLANDRYNIVNVDLNCH